MVMTTIHSLVVVHSPPPPPLHPLLPYQALIDMAEHEHRRAIKPRPIRDRVTFPGGAVKSVNIESPLTCCQKGPMGTRESSVRRIWPAAVKVFRTSHAGVVIREVFAYKQGPDRRKVMFTVNKQTLPGAIIRQMTA